METRLVKDGIGMNCQKMFGDKNICGTKNCSIVKVLKTGESYQQECKRQRKDGSIVTTLEQISPYKDKEGNIVGIIEDFRDITEIKTLEKKLIESSETTQKILENMPFGVMIIGKDKKVRSINKAALKIIDRKEEEIVGKICHNYICPAEVDKCPVLDLGNTVDSSEKIVLGTSGKKIPILKTILPVELDGETVLLEAFFDISERKQSEMELEEKLDELERWKKVTVGREIQMRNLKERIKELEGELLKINEDDNR